MSSRGVPEVLMKKVDEYVDSLAPQIQPRITSELNTFQQKTIDSLESQVIDAFRSLFNKDKGSSGGGNTSRSAWSLDDAPPDAYGRQSLPFADELAKLSRGFSKIADEAGDDVRDIFDLTEGRDRPGDAPRSRGGDGGDVLSRGAKGFLSSALNVVQDRLDSNSGRSSGGQGFELDGLLGVLSNTVKDATRDPEEKARLISPEIREKVGAKLQEQHAPIAEQFTRIALEHIKRWLRGNTSTRDLGDGMRGEVQDQVKDLVKGIGNLFGSSKSEGGTRSVGGDRSRDGDEDEQSRGFSGVISDKLSTGIARVHREVRLEFRKILGKIEKQLFELLPDVFQRPLEKILGGNPFDSQLDRDAGSRDRGIGGDIKSKLLDKIRGLIRKVQETLRESILGVVNGGHRRFERESWVFVQKTVEQKVQKYLPKVKITVPDDIGNEGVSVGDPTNNAQAVGGNQPMHSAQGGVNPSFSQGQYDGQGYSQPDYNGSSQQGQRPDHRPDQDYRPDYQGSQGYRPDSQPPSSYRPEEQQSQGYRPSQQQQGYRPDYNQEQDYRPGNQQGQDYRPDYQSEYQQQGHRPDYREDQGYRPQQYQSQQESRPPHHANQQYDSQGYGSQQYRPNEPQEYRPNQQYGQNPRY